MRSISIQRYELQDILSHIRTALAGGPEKIELDGELVAVTSVRLRTFAFHGTRCVSCGIQGAHFRKELAQPTDPRPHLALYATGQPDMIEVLMTKDHIVPRARGGSDALWNMQPMCLRCNERKGDSMEPDILTPSPDTRQPCHNYTPSGWYRHWREWHRGHGCALDDGQPPPPEDYWTKDRHR
jgi:hypothetical protein